MQLKGAARFLRPLAAPIPLPLLQPFLRRTVEHIAATRPSLFNRLGPHQTSVFLIDPVNLPFVFILQPNSQQPELRACRRRNLPHYDARIAGTFLTLLTMVDGNLDGDSLFFMRGITVEGDTEAVVCLRNALDDLDGSVIQDIAQRFGKSGEYILNLLLTLGKHHYG